MVVNIIIGIAKLIALGTKLLIKLYFSLLTNYPVATILTTIFVIVTWNL
ncbi:hypothetical protein AB3331_09335 [Streptococcus sp. H49]